MNNIRRSWAQLSFEKKLGIVIVPLLVAVIGGGVTLLAARGGGSSPAPNIFVDTKKERVPQFKGVAGHLKNSRAILDFLNQNDGKPVRLEVGFPNVHSEDFIVKDVPLGDGTVKLTVTYVQLFTECTPGLSPGEYPSFAKGCLATSLELRGPETDDSVGFLQHGIPVLKGYFAVDITGALHMGVRPIGLKPLTYKEATGS